VAITKNNGITEGFHTKMEIYSAKPIAPQFSKLSIAR
jgi:hypothetical protein